MAKGIKELTPLESSMQNETLRQLLFETVFNAADASGIYARKVTFDRLETEMARTGESAPVETLVNERVSAERARAKSVETEADEASPELEAALSEAGGTVAEAPNLAAAIVAENERARQVEGEIDEIPFQVRGESLSLSIKKENALRDTQRGNWTAEFIDTLPAEALVNLASALKYIGGRLHNLDVDIADESDARRGADGILSQLTTPYKDNLVSAINWLRDEIINHNDDHMAHDNITGDFLSIERVEGNNQSLFKVMNGGITEAKLAPALAEKLNGKQDALTFDDTPTEDSENPVTSGGVFDAIADAVEGAIPELPAAPASGVKRYVLQVTEDGEYSWVESA